MKFDRVEAVQLALNAPFLTVLSALLGCSVLAVLLVTLASD